MTEFKRTTEDLVSLEELFSVILTDVSTTAPEKMDKVAAAKVTKITRYTACCQLQLSLSLSKKRRRQRAMVVYGRGD